ncbi:MAG: hypothetical protein FWG94_03535 [Oscillospiraceae bacterium]|nr:hypothetical protein [Oscillospiraceae bacterium]
MKFLMRFFLGFIISFFPYLIIHGRLLFALPFMLVGFTFAPTILVIISAIIGIVEIKRRKEGALGWILGAIAAWILGDILFFMHGFNFVPV